MWEKLFDLMTKVFTLTSKVDRLEKDNEKLQRELDRLTETVNKHAAKIDVLVYAVQSESDKTKMWVEKELAKFERRLPSGKEENEK
jgi:outer membrane murein-binding lipoprotein Lpp